MSVATAIRCRRLDLFDDEDLAAYHDVYTEAGRYQRPYFHSWSLRTMTTWVRWDDPTFRRTLWGAFDGDQMVGTGFLGGSDTDNLEKGQVVVAVRPGRRRAGIGSMLLDEVLTCAAERGRTDLTARVVYALPERDGHPDVQFALSRGFHQLLTDKHNVLDLPMSEALLLGLVAEAAPHHTAYRIRHFVGPLSEDLLPSICRLENDFMTDTPTGDQEWEPAKVTPEVLAEAQETARKSGTEVHTVVACAPDGEVVAITELGVPDDQEGVVLQFGTISRRDHRGHRLGLAIKARNLLEVQRAHPDRTVVHTDNADSNPWMVSINDRLGFRPVEIGVELRRLA